MDYTDKVRALNPEDVPFTETDAYRFWFNGGYEDHRAMAKQSYLESLGFEVGKDTVSEDVLRCMGYIHDAVFHDLLEGSARP